MQIAAKPSNESARLRALHAYRILDTPPEAAFDDLAQLTAQVCGTPIAVVSLVDADRQWFKARVGLDGQQTSRDIAFCAHVVLGGRLLVVPDARLDPRFHDNPLVTGEPGIRFYAGMPLLTGDGLALGALCAIDRQPRELTTLQREVLEVIARQVVAQFEAHRTFLRVREIATQRQEFLRVASHDLRNPLHAIMASAEIIDELLRAGAPEAGEVLEFAGIISERARTMHRLISDLLDADAIEAGALRFTYAPVDLAPLVREVVAAHGVQAEQKGIRLEACVPLALPPVEADRSRTQQVLENLVGNALKFSPSGTVVRVRAAEHGPTVRVEVCDEGPGLAEADLVRLFVRYARLSARPTAGEPSTGLGLAICKEFVEVQGGNVGAANNTGRGATFWFTLPREP